MMILLVVLSLLIALPMQALILTTTDGGSKEAEVGLGIEPSFVPA